MIRARFFALALLFGACCWGDRPVSAQEGYPGSPYRTPAPMSGADWYQYPEDPPGPEYGLGPTSMFDGSFLRVEYLHWNLDHPGDVLLGAPVRGISDPRQPFVVFSPGSGSPLAVTRVPDLHSINLDDTNGIRLVGGLELTYGGTIEVGAFMLAKKESGYKFSGFGDTFIGTFPALVSVPVTMGTSVLNNGQVGDTVFLYNQSFEAQYQSQLWGGEANYVGDYDNDGLFHLNPTVGVRYFSLHERLLQTGVFQDSVLGTEIVTTIDSVTYNNLYGPQVGARLELISKYINLGLDPKLMLLTNTMLGSVTTNRLRSNADPLMKTDETTTSFSFGVDIGTYAQINLHKSFSVRVGYNFIWFGRVTRPEENIYYNDNGASAPPGVITKLTKHDFFVHGVSVAGELRF
jgi:Putative beta barrel porin-7 (BBP7)